MAVGSDGCAEDDGGERWIAAEWEKEKGRNAYLDEMRYDFHGLV